MARSAKGWTLYTDPRTGCQIVRFTWAGRRHNISTREREPEAASQAAARIYADVVAGRPRASRRVSSDGVPLGHITEPWLRSLRLDGGTVAMYAMYAEAHWEPHFVTLDGVDANSAAKYVEQRLARVTRSTVLKELAALRGFMRWAKAQGHVDAVPLIESPPANVTGTRHATGTREIVELSEDELDAVLAAIPERTAIKNGRGGNPARAFFTVLAETGLRRSTLFRLRAPQDYHVGRPTLRIRPETDKARFGRELPITDGARAALDSVCPVNGGVIFEVVDYRDTIKRAARAAGLSEHRVARLGYHDFRHARTTHLLERTQNLAGVAFLVGHKNVTTTNRYVRPNQRAGEAALRDAFRPPSGHRKQKAKRTPKGPS